MEHVEDIAEELHEEIEQAKIESGAEHDEVDAVPEQPFDEQEFMNYVIKLVIWESLDS